MGKCVYITILLKHYFEREKNNKGHVYIYDIVTLLKIRRCVMVHCPRKSTSRNLAV